MSEESEIFVGDVVVLKSGGPKMVVDSRLRNDNTKVRVVWVDSHGIHNSVFNNKSIRKASVENKGADNNIKPGDVVVLPSGSPEMTVSVINIDLVTVEWFDSNNVFSYCFPLSALKKVC